MHQSLNTKAVVCFGDGKFFGRALVTLASAGLVTDADLRIYSWPRAWPAGRLPARIQFIDAIQAAATCDWQVQYRSKRPYPFWLKMLAALHTLQQGYQQVLLMDSDCLVIGDLSELWAKTAEHGISACLDVGTFAHMFGQNSPAIRLRALKLVEMAAEDYTSWPYIIAGVIGFEHKPRVLQLLDNLVQLCSRHPAEIRELFFPEQDLFNLLLCKYKINAAVLDQFKYGFWPDVGTDKRIVHWAGRAQDRISHLWIPYMSLIERATANLGMSFTVMRYRFPVEYDSQHHPV